MFSYRKIPHSRAVILAISFSLIVPSAFPQSRLNTTADSNRIASYITISKTYQESQPDSAVDYCYQGMKLAEKNNDLQGQALLLLQLGRINAIHHHPDLARRFTNEALSIFRNLHDWSNIAVAYNELGLLDGSVSINAATGDLGQSMKFYEDIHDSIGIATTYHSLGTVYEEKGETEKALTYYLRALIHYEHRAQKTDEYFVLLQRISRIYTQKGDRLAALNYLEEGIRNTNNPMFRDTEITMLEEEGQLMEKAGENTNAIAYYKKELDVAKKYNNLEGQAKALADIGGVLKKDNVARSLEYLKRALVIAAPLRQPQLKASIYEALAGVYRQEKNYKEAMIVLGEHNRLLDSLLTAKTNSDISALDTSYQLEASRDQIDQLQEVNKKGRTERNLGLIIIAIVLAVLLLLWIYLRKIKRLNRKLHESNQIKTKLFSIIGHDLKAPAGNAVQLLEILAEGAIPEEQHRKLLYELKKQSTASYDLLNALFEWGQTQLEGVVVKPEFFATSPLIQKNSTLLAPLAARKRITITDHTPLDTKLNIDPNHFDFIIRNLLSNAIKFTHEQGQIEIHQTTQDHEIIFSVKDTGIGISAVKQEIFLKNNLPVSFGTKGEKGSGLGLLLIREFINANKGHIWLKSKEGEGSTFYVAFPRP